MFISPGQGEDEQEDDMQDEEGKYKILTYLMLWLYLLLVVARKTNAERKKCLFYLQTRKK